MTTVTFTSSGTWTSPAGLTTTDCQCWGEGGSGANGLAGGSSHSGGGGGGGEFAEETALVVHGSANYTFTIGSGGSGTNTSFPGDSVTVTAHAGASGASTSGGGQGSGSTNSIHHDGGHGGNGIVGSTKGGGGGGSSAGTGAAGANGGAGGAAGGAGGIAPSGGGNGGDGSGPSLNNAAAGSVPGGGGGGGSTHSGSAGAVGASGQIVLNYTAVNPGTATLSGIGTLTAAGSVVNTSGPPIPTQIAPGRTWLRHFGQDRRQVLPGRQVQTLTVGASLSGVGTLAGFGALPNPVVVNQWANSYGQGTTFGSTTSSLQSCVVQLSPADSVGVGSGTPTPGNWLFTIASWTQLPQVANVHVGVSDDTHPWWRQFPASGSGQNVRTSVSYCPNIGTGSSNTVVPQYVYVAPDMEIAAINVLVVEVSGLGPWDSVTGQTTNFTGSGTSVNLALSAPAAAAFTIAGIGGDNVGSGQAFAPGGWTALATQTQSNGSDTTADNILTSAFLPSTIGSVNVNGTSSSAEDLSGFILQVRVTGVNPVPANQNPNWPYAKFEAAFGAGYNTPNSELTWTDLTTRLWSWDEITGIQFQLGQLQSSNLNLEIDNYDGSLTPVSSPWSFTTTGTPSNNSFFTVTTAQSASISLGDGFTDTSNPGTFFTVTNIGLPSGGNVNITYSPASTNLMSNPDVVSQASLASGTPIRLRMALGTMGGQAINRWYIIQRNIHEWEEELNASYRRFCPVSGTDMWAAMSSVPPTFYRSEIYEDGPTTWYPMDDQVLEGGVLPTTLLNAATGNTTVMNIVASPNGITTQDAYSTNGIDVTQKPPATGAGPPPSVSTYQVGANSGWMYGDPPSAASSTSASGNPVEASPGSASWQQSGTQGTSGSNGWFLSAHNNSFPGLSGGVTVKGWFNPAFFGSATGWEYFGFDSDVSVVVAGQPYSVLTVCTIATASAPVAVLQLDLSGHLNLITYNGTTGTSHSIYSGSDLRSATWISVDILLTTTTWRVLVNGGLTADVSGSATGMTSAWTYLILNGDMGTGGGANTSSIAHGGNIAYSHWAVFPYLLPEWRLLSHYTAAITGFGLLPPPIPSAQSVLNPPLLVSSQQRAGGYGLTPDGAASNGSYGHGSNSSFTLSAVVTANAGAFSSGPSAWAVTGATGQTLQTGPTTGDNTDFGNAVWVAWVNTVAPFYTIYTGASVGAEKAAATVLGSGDAFTSGYGATAVSASGDVIGSGSGASPPTASTSLGDAVGARIERLMRAGRCTSPQRSIDPAPALVQAPGIAGGGTQTSTNVQAIQQSDSGFLFVDNPGNLTYWMRSHLASQYANPVWKIGPDTASGQIPYYRDYRLVNDPQRIFNVITVQPFSPSGAQLPLLTPTDSTGVRHSQIRYGAQAYQVISWLQDQSLMQAQADWLFSNFGQPQTRAEMIRIDAAPYPLAWNLFAGLNVGDVITLEEWEIGNGGQQLTLRVTEINRKFRFGGQDEGNHGEGTVVASVELTCDFEPTSYWGV